MKEKKHYWSDEEIIFLKENVNNYTNAELATKLNRSTSSVMNKINSLQIRRKLEYDGDLPDEKWKKLSENYLVSNMGRVYSKLYNCLIQFSENNKGYLYFTQYLEDGTAKSTLTHIEVARLFVPKPKGIRGLEVNHKNGNKLDIKHINLEWVTHKQNMEHARETGLHSNFKYGEENPLNKVPDSTVHKICELLVANCTDRFIADECNVTRDYVCRIRLKKRSRHISEQYF